ncbi:terminase small subunit [Ruminococcus flavefaciens]|uniref:Phage terminase small subunit n=1 Tax=Ruminococcus flavefaciens TaxID=1265 RepID=A0A315Y306_RUMFL|nr:terminase small subunit [Ruminococcus flavefaciens]PWJ14620.1 phage terminase small subunit [Ruminococcus flavefaciens]SSA42650.1 phage terminase small subunit [Ruminococcus flavefaciens]
MKLTEKQKRFCEEYLVDLNATQAAARAGYKDPNIGRQLITKNNVSQYIEKLRKEQAKRTGISADKVINELAAIAFSDRTELAKVDDYGVVRLTPTDRLSTEAKKTISGIKEGKYGTEVSSYDKLRALELLGKHFGLFTEQMTAAGEQELPKLFKALEEGDDESIEPEPEESSE